MVNALLKTKKVQSSIIEPVINQQTYYTMKLFVILKSQKSIMEKAYTLNSDWGSNLPFNFYTALNKGLTF